MRRETLTLLDASARESHPFTCSSSVTSATFPLCVSNLVNAECVITLARLTAGLKRTLRNQKTSPPFYRREKNEWIEIVFPFFLFLLLPFFFRNHRPHAAAPNSFHHYSLLFLHGKNESYTKLRKCENFRDINSRIWMMASLERKRELWLKFFSNIGRGPKKTRGETILFSSPREGDT